MKDIIVWIISNYGIGKLCYFVILFGNDVKIELDFDGGIFILNKLIQFVQEFFRRSGGFDVILVLDKVKIVFKFVFVRFNVWKVLVVIIDK